MIEVRLCGQADRIIHKLFLARSCERGSGKRLSHARSTLGGSGATYSWRGLSIQNSTVEWWCVAQCGSGAVWKSGAVRRAVQWTGWVRGSALTRPCS